MSAMPSIQSPLSKVLTLEDQLNGAFIERRDVIRSILIALIAEENVLLLGPPGTAKSDLARSLSNAMQSSYFEYCLTKFTTPEEIFGPVSIQKLKKDIYERKTSSTLADAEIGFLDEIFKANSAILNSMLPVINEKTYHNGNHKINVPLQMAIGASNEYPQDTSLAALYDRFIIRHWVDYLTEQGMFELLSGNLGIVTQKITLNDLDDLRSQRKSVDVSNITRAMINIRTCLLSEHQITVSDRTWVKLTKIVSANALLDGRSVADSSDLMALKDCLWSHHEDKNTIEEVIRQNQMSDSEREAKRLLEISNEMYRELKEQPITDEEKRRRTIVFWSQQRMKFDEIINDLNKLDQSDPCVVDVLTNVQDQRFWISSMVEQQNKI